MIRVATEKDLGSINSLLTRNRLNLLSLDHLRDVCLVAEIDDKIRGVIWAGVCESKTMAWVDYFAVDPDFGNLVLRLGRQLVKMLDKKGVYTLLFLATQSGHSWIPEKINERFGLYCYQEPFFVVSGKIKGVLSNGKRTTRTAPTSSSA